MNFSAINYNNLYPFQLKRITNLVCEIEPIHILIIEDNQILRDRIVQAISGEADRQIVAAVDSGFNSTKIIVLQPDVI